MESYPKKDEGKQTDEKPTQHQYEYAEVVEGQVAEADVAPYKVNPDGSVQYYPDIQQANFTQIYSASNPYFMQPQSMQTTQILKDILAKDPYNYYCVDCKKNQSDHASLTFGLFLCGPCAMKHKELLGMDKSYIKSLFNENWDEYQIKHVALGGNKGFFEFMKAYEVKDEDIKKKYEHRAAQWWSKKLRSEVDGKPFTVAPPSKKAGWQGKTEDILKVTEKKSQEWILKAGAELEKGGNWLGKKINNILKQ